MDEARRKSTLTPVFRIGLASFSQYVNLIPFLEWAKDVVLRAVWVVAKFPEGDSSATR